MAKENSDTENSDSEIIAEIIDKIKNKCAKGHYKLNDRIKTEAGLAYVVNRVIFMMVHDKIHLGAALAHLESEEHNIY